MEIFSLSISEKKKSLLKVQFMEITVWAVSMKNRAVFFFFFFFLGEENLVEYIGGGIILFLSDLKILALRCSSVLTHENHIQCPHFPSLSEGSILWLL